MSTTDRDLAGTQLDPDAPDAALTAVDRDAETDATVAVADTSPEPTDAETAAPTTRRRKSAARSRRKSPTWLDRVENEREALPVDTVVADTTATAPTDVGDDLVVAPASPDVLEELRRADVDGPVVPMAPQDDTSSGIRRPKRALDYDPAPMPIAPDVPRVLGRRPRVRRVTRVVRHVDPWSVFKIALVANLILYLILLTAGVLLWNVAYATGTIDNVERFLESFGWSTFEFNGGEIFHNLWIAGLFAVIGLTGLAVLLATLFNLITDLVGGVRLTVLEEEVVETRTSPMRRFIIRRPEPEVPLVSRDETGSTIREAVIDDSGSLGRSG